jgi:hypothetical protein
MMRMDVVTNAHVVGDNGKITIGSFLDFGVLECPKDVHLLDKNMRSKK